MRIQHPTLRACCQDRVVYIVGTGPSMRLFDVECLRGQTTIALNQAWRYWIGKATVPTMAITVHPELVLEYEAAKAKGAQVPHVRWVVKKKPPLESLSLDDPRYHVFHTRPDWDTISEAPADTLFIGRGVQQTAMDLAARLGARCLVLVGVDMTDLGGEHHGHAQHVQFHGLPPADVYAEYRAWTRKARTRIEWKYAIPTLTLSPLLGAGHAEEDYAHLCMQRKLKPLPPPEDISWYNRPKADL